MNKSDLVALNRKIFYARKEWYELIDKYYLNEKLYRGNSERSKEKTIYFVKRGKWADPILRKIISFQKEFKSLGYVGSTKPKRLWLPTIIENADEITVVVYSALSQRQLSPDQVEKFKSKYEGDYISHTDRGDFICTPTGRDYKIRVEYEGTVTYYPFSEWVICLCKNNKLPEVKNIKNKGRL